MYRIFYKSINNINNKIFDLVESNFTIVKYCFKLKFKNAIYVQYLHWLSKLIIPVINIKF